MAGQRLFGRGHAAVTSVLWFGPCRALAVLGVCLAVAPLGYASWAQGSTSASVVTYNLPPFPQQGFGGCRFAAHAPYITIELPWGRTPDRPGFDNFCRGFTLINLRTGARRVAVRLPLSEHKQTWIVDEPVLLGNNWLGYLHYHNCGCGPWDVEVVNLRTGVTRRLDHGDGSTAMGAGPWLTGWGSNLLWVSPRPVPGGKVIDQIHSFNGVSGASQILATSRPGGPRYDDAYMSGPLVVFLALRNHGSDAWVKDLRTGRLQQITHTNRASEAVVMGPWVAWAVNGKNALGPVMVRDLRTGQTWMATKEPSYVVSAGDGLLTWLPMYASQTQVLDLVTGQPWTLPRLSSQQEGPTTAVIRGNVVIEEATIPESKVFIRVQVYPQRRLPGAPKL